MDTTTSAQIARQARTARLEEAAKVLGCTFMNGEYVVTWFENGEFKARGGMTGRGASELVKHQMRNCKGITGSHADKVFGL